MTLFDSTRTLGVPGGSFYADFAMDQSCSGRAGSTLQDVSDESDLSSDLSGGAIATCSGRTAEYQVRERLSSSPDPLPGPRLVSARRLRARPDRTRRACRTGLRPPKKYSLTVSPTSPTPPPAANCHRQRQVQYRVARRAPPHQDRRRCEKGADLRDHGRETARGLSQRGAPLAVA